jgi:SAM-dependent methyltransferase
MNYEDATYGDRIAAIYDELYGEVDEATITLLSELADGGRALELGIGTGRIALPLQQTGTEVHGVDASAAMVARLRAKPGGETIPITMGSFADLHFEETFALVYVVFNTFYGLLTQAEQIRCFQSVADHLTPDGLFLLEVFVPDLARFEAAQTVRATRVDLDGVQLDVSRHDAVSQRIASQHVLLSEEGVKLYPVQLRYAWPAEMDLMAQLAGLALRHRWGSWRRAPFTSESGKHISVYARRRVATP